jgi:hypothetical protein
VWGIAFSLEGLARLAVEEHEPEQALVLAGAADRRRQTVAVPLPAVSRRQMDIVLARARAALPEATANAAFTRGQRLDHEALVAWLRADGILPGQ